MNELRPCPFCGGKAHLFSTGKIYEREFFRIFCLKNCCMQSSFYDDPMKAVMDWNRRAGESDA